MLTRKKGIRNLNYVHRPIGMKSPVMDFTIQHERRQVMVFTVDIPENLPVLHTPFQWESNRQRI